MHNTLLGHMNHLHMQLNFKLRPSFICQYWVCQRNLCGRLSHCISEASRWVLGLLSLLVSEGASHMGFLVWNRLTNGLSQFNVAAVVPQCFYSVYKRLCLLSCTLCNCLYWPRYKRGRPCVKCDARWAAGGWMVADSTPRCCCVMLLFVCCLSQFKSSGEVAAFAKYLELKIPSTSPIGAEHRLKTEMWLDVSWRLLTIFYLAVIKESSKGIYS